MDNAYSRHQNHATPVTEHYSWLPSWPSLSSNQMSSPIARKWLSQFIRIFRYAMLSPKGFSPGYNSASFKSLVIRDSNLLNEGISASTKNIMNLLKGSKAILVRLP